MDIENLKNIWQKKYADVPLQLQKVKNIKTVATAFNTNVDAVLKIKGESLKKLILDNNIPLSSLDNITLTEMHLPTDVILGIVKCFVRGIAEEWVTEDKSIYDWMAQNLGYDRLQMGGQGGIIANTLALLKINKVIAHTNSHPALQAEQFLDLDNLFAIDENGELAKACEISRDNDIPLIHWIIEFDKGDSFNIDGKEFTCPKSNRFIATYDPLNLNLVIDRNFVSYLNNTQIDYLILSGFHPLLARKNGIELIKNAVPLIKQWQKNNPQMITHLEVASTQDLAVRKAIVEYIAPLMQSAGLNERETIDLLNVCDGKDLAQKIERETTAPNLFDALLYLKQKLDIPRLQLHMFGLYLTLQDARFPFSGVENLRGMLTAAVVSSSKAYNGALEKYQDITLTLDVPPSDIGLGELTSLAQKLNKPELAENGICEFNGMFVSAVPTILVDKPKTLVGMGDTISSISLIAGR